MKSARLPPAVGAQGWLKVGLGKRAKGCAGPREAVRPPTSRPAFSAAMAAYASRAAVASCSRRARSRAHCVRAKSSKPTLQPTEKAQLGARWLDSRPRPCSAPPAVITWSAALLASRSACSRSLRSSPSKRAAASLSAADESPPRFTRATSWKVAGRAKVSPRPESGSSRTLRVLWGTAHRRHPAQHGRPCRLALPPAA